jgi:hypothetical protein
VRNVQQAGGNGSIGPQSVMAQHFQHASWVGENGERCRAAVRGEVCEYVAAGGSHMLISLSCVHPVARGRCFDSVALPPTAARSFVR